MDTLKFGGRKLIVTYDTKVEKVLCDDKLLKRTVDAQLAIMIRKREGNLKDFRNFWDYFQNGLGKPHPLVDSKKKKDEGLFGVSLTENMRLIIKPNCESTDQKSLEECEEVIIMGVRDYHGTNEKWIMP